MRTLNLIILNTLIAAFFAFYNVSSLLHPNQLWPFHVGFALGALGMIALMAAVLTLIVKAIQFFLSLRLV